MVVVESGRGVLNAVVELVEVVEHYLCGLSLADRWVDVVAVVVVGTRVTVTNRLDALLVTNN